MSSDRNLEAGLAAALAQPHVAWFPMVKMEFDSGTVRVCGLDVDVEYPAGSGEFWTRTRGYGGMEPIVEGGDTIQGITFTLAGIPQSVLIEAQQEKYQGRKCTVLMAILGDGVVYVDPAVWQGRLDQRTITVGAKASTITVTAEHSMVDWKRPYERLFNSASQKLVDPNDTFYDGLEDSMKVEKVIFSKEIRRYSTK